MSPRQRNPFGTRRQSLRRYRAVITLELLACVPLWLIGLLGVILFGELLVDLQQVSLAGRVGAEQAARSVVLPASGPLAANDPIVEAAANQLASAGLITDASDPDWGLILEHNQGGTLELDYPDNSPPVSAPSPALLPGTGTYVRVTVWVKASRAAPNLLRSFGLDISSKHIVQSTTFRHE